MQYVLGLDSNYVGTPLEAKVYTLSMGILEPYILNLIEPRHIEPLCLGPLRYSLQGL